MWSTENPHAVHETPLHRVKIGLWCTVSRPRIFGPIFFENIANSEPYIDIIHDFVGHITEEEISEAWTPTGQRDISYSTGDCARATPVVRRWNNFERTMAPTLSGLIEGYIK
jgi:hypothetical protein